MKVTVKYIENEKKAEFKNVKHVERDNTNLYLNTETSVLTIQNRIVESFEVDF